MTLSDLIAPGLELGKPQSFPTHWLHPGQGTRVQRPAMGVKTEACDNRRDKIASQHPAWIRGCAARHPSWVWIVAPASHPSFPIITSSPS